MNSLVQNIHQWTYSKWRWLKPFPQDDIILMCDIVKAAKEYHREQTSPCRDPIMIKTTKDKLYRLLEDLRDKDFQG